MSITVKNLHKDLAEDQLHEAKGFTTASNNTYLKKNHEGSSEWLSEYWLQPVLGVVTGASAPPTESSGDRYILTGSSFNAGWDSPSQHEIVEYNGTSWVGIAAVDGMRVVDLSNDSVYYFNTAWNQVTDAGITGIGDTLTSATQGSVLFAGASGVLAQDNTNLFWDDSNNRLGIGTNSPSFDLHVLNSGDLDTKVESNGGHSRFIIDSQDTDDSILQFNENNNRRWSIYTDGSDDKLKITRSDVPTASPTSDAISIDTSDNVSIPNGTLTINDYTFPSADGSASQVLQTDGNGALTFATVSGGGATDLDGLSDAQSTANDLTLGTGAGNDMSTGTATYNTYLGVNAGYDSDTDTTQNVAVGYSALENNESGDYQVAVGFQALHQGTTGTSANTAVGWRALKGSTGGFGNVAIGYDTMSTAGALGDYNVAVGYQALKTYYNSQYAIGIGYQAGYANRDEYSVLIGHKAAYGAYGVGTSNVYIGDQVAYKSTTASKNVAIGFKAAYDITIGADNVIIGNLAAENITEGEDNIILGTSAADNLTTGDNNIYIGNAIDASSATVSNELRIGSGSVLPISADLSTGAVTINSAYTLPTAVTGANDYVLTAQTDGTTAWAAVSGGGGASDLDGLADVKVQASSTSGRYSLFINGATAGAAAQHGTLDNAQANYAIGKDTLKAITTGDFNVGIGFENMTTLAGATNGKGNVTMGYKAGRTLTGEYNVVIGYDAGSDISGGDNIVAIGRGAMGNSSPYNGLNVCVGYNSGNHQTSGQKNVMVGADTGTSDTSGYHNTFLGYDSGDTITTGHFNVFVGSQTDGVADVNNQIAIGYQAESDGANTIQMGNSSISTADIQVSWTVASDERVKDNITDAAIGLDFINALRPVTFTKIHPADYPTEIRDDRYKQGGADYDEETEAPIKDEFDTTTVHDGLIAQEVKATMDSLGVGFSGWKEKADGRQGIQYEALVMPLIKAVQELSAKVKALENA